jgi:1-deoxyxylulose-5-phosphate synthase
VKTGTTRARTDDFAHQLYYQEDDFTVVEKLRGVAAAAGKTLPQAALAWMLSKPYVTAPIIGASRIEHLEQAVEALSISLSPGQVTALEEPYKPHKVLGH